MDASQPKKHLTLKNIAVSLLVIVIIIVVILNIFGKQKEQTPLSKKQAACPPVSGKGKQTYTVMTDKPKDLQIVQIDVDPMDVKHGKTQKITVKVKDASRTNLFVRNKTNTSAQEGSVSATIHTDTKSAAVSAFTLLPQKNSKDDSSFISTWEGFWTRDDSYCRIYMETIIAKNSKGEESKIDLSFK